jgi:HK97 gp10 family phage protein
VAVRARIVVKSNRLPGIAAKCRPAIRRAVHAAGFRAEAGAKGRAAVDTGHMRGAIANRPGDLSTTIHSPAAYSLFVERGTRKMAAQPFMEPAVDAVIPGLQADLAKAVAP